MIEQFGVMGEYEIIVINSLTKEIIQKQKIKNRLMNATLNELAKVYIGDTPDLTIKYLAVGTDNTPITDTDATLGAEVFRTEPILDPELVNLGEVKTTFAIIDTEAQVVIEEIGIFGGSSATGTVDTGTLISRILWNYDKTVSNIEIQITRTDKVVRS